MIEKRNMLLSRIALILGPQGAAVYNYKVNSDVGLSGNRLAKRGNTFRAQFTVPTFSADVNTDACLRLGNPQQLSYFYCK